MRESLTFSIPSDSFKVAGNVIFEAQVAVALLTHFTFFENGLKIGAFSCHFHLWFGAVSKKVVLLGGAHHKVAYPPP